MTHFSQNYFLFHKGKEISKKNANIILSLERISFYSEFSLLTNPNEIRFE